MAAYYKVSATVNGDTRDYVVRAGSFAMATAKALDMGDRSIPQAATLELVVEKFHNDHLAALHAKELRDRGIWHQGDAGPFVRSGA